MELIMKPNIIYLILGIFIKHLSAYINAFIKLLSIKTTKC